MSFQLQTWSFTQCEIHMAMKCSATICHSKVSNLTAKELLWHFDIPHKGSAREERQSVSSISHTLKFINAKIVGQKKLNRIYIGPSLTEKIIMKLGRYFQANMKHSLLTKIIWDLKIWLDNNELFTSLYRNGTIHPWNILVHGEQSGDYVCVQFQRPEAVLERPYYGIFQLRRKTPLDDSAWLIRQMMLSKISESHINYSKLLAELTGVGAVNER